MEPRKNKIDLDFITPNSSFVYPLYTEKGIKILDARKTLTSEMINTIKRLYGHILYYTDSSKTAEIPRYRINIAYNISKRLLDEIEKTDKLTKSIYREAEQVIDEILHDVYTIDINSVSLLKELHAFDEYLYNHSVNVSVMTALFALKLGTFTKDEIKAITFGGYLLDIGQKKIDQQLLNKQGKLNISEFQKMKRHPQLGYELLRQINEENPIILQSVLFHHEKYNNRGYYQLPYDHLPQYPKIISICDVYDALTSERPYRKYALNSNNALKSILNAMNYFFDKELVTNFITLMSPLLNDTESFYVKDDICELDSDELAIITEINPDNLLAPVVLIFCKFEKSSGRLAVHYHNQPEIVYLEHDTRNIKKIVNNQKHISMIKKSLKERGIL